MRNWMKTGQYMLPEHRHKQTERFNNKLIEFQKTNTWNWLDLVLHPFGVEESLPMLTCNLMVLKVFNKFVAKSFFIIIFLWINGFLGSQQLST